MFLPLDPFKDSEEQKPTLVINGILCLLVLAAPFIGAAYGIYLWLFR